MRVKQPEPFDREREYKPGERAIVNGALNIGRKVFGDSFMITDSGRWYRPERINVLKCVCENVH